MSLVCICVLTDGLLNIMDTGVSPLICNSISCDSTRMSSLEEKNEK